jgi:hypothetical protein
MKLSEVKRILNASLTIGFQLPHGELVPRHFHVTEVGKIVKHFIDCGGTVREESVINFQLWNADDYDHRLHPDKLIKIIELSEAVLQLEDWEIEVEYQGDTIGKYGLDYNGKYFLLTQKHTDCLAREKCNLPINSSLSDAIPTNIVSCCDSGSNCC